MSVYYELILIWWNGVRQWWTRHHCDGAKQPAGIFWPNWSALSSVLPQGRSHLCSVIQGLLESLPVSFSCPFPFTPGHEPSASVLWSSLCPEQVFPAAAILYFQATCQPGLPSCFLLLCRLHQELVSVLPLRQCYLSWLHLTITIMFLESHAVCFDHLVFIFLEGHECNPWIFLQLIKVSVISHMELENTVSFCCLHSIKSWAMPILWIVDLLISYFISSSIR